MENNSKIISAEELYELMFTGKDLAGHDITLINVLDHDCFNDCHIKGSINIDCENLADDVKDWDRNKSIIVYCASSQCPLNQAACETLVGMGFSNVKAYQGGMKEWRNLGYPSEGACALDYLASETTPQTKMCPVCKESRAGCLCS